jgi:hypothetical protein
VSEAVQLSLELGIHADEQLSCEGVSHGWRRQRGELHRLGLKPYLDCTACWTGLLVGLDPGDLCRSEFTIEVRNQETPDGLAIHGGGLVGVGGARTFVQESFGRVSTAA